MKRLLLVSYYVERERNTRGKILCGLVPTENKKQRKEELYLVVIYSEIGHESSDTQSSRIGFGLHQVGQYFIIVT